MLAEGLDCLHFGDVLHGGSDHNSSWVYVQKRHKILRVMVHRESGRRGQGTTRVWRREGSEIGNVTREHLIPVR